MLRNLLRKKSERIVMMKTIFIVSFFLSRPHDWLVRMNEKVERENGMEIKVSSPSSDIFTHSLNISLKVNEDFFLPSVVAASFVFSSFTRLMTILPCSTTKRRHYEMYTLR